MKLRTQLLLAGAVTLLLPVMAFRTVQQLDAAFRDTREFELRRNTDGIRALLQHSGSLLSIDPGDLPDDPRDLYAEKIRQAIVLDGYGDDWETHRLPERLFHLPQQNAGDATDIAVGVKLAVSRDRLYLLLAARDQQVVYHRPRAVPVGSEFALHEQDPEPETIASGDHVILYTTNAAGLLQKTFFRAIAPGPVVGRRYGRIQEGVRTIRQIPQFRGFWTATGDGYQLEISLPLPAVNSEFGLAVIDAAHHRPLASQAAWMGTVDPNARQALGKLVYASREIEALFAEVVPKGSRARLFDQHGHLRAELNRLYQRPDNPALLDPARSSLFNALLFRYFEWMISTRHAQTGTDLQLHSPFLLNLSALAGDGSDLHQVRRYINLERDQVLGSLVPLRSAEHSDMYLLFETNEDAANAFTSSAMVRMFSLVTLIGLLVAGSLFAYASWLSWRIKRLSVQARSAVSGDGRFLNAIKGSAAGDEIGQLSRNFAQLVERSAGYTQYLESLASKLSHELRTPLSVVQTSLENIDSADFSHTDRQLLDRAQGGAAQLSILIKAMSEAARLEQTVQRSEFVQFDTVHWLENVRNAYSDVYQQRNFVCRTAKLNRRELLAVPELLQQALDKLISNAVDFSDPGSRILIIAEDADNYFDLAVVNQGAQLDEARVDQLFEPMFSQRTKQNGASHLGLGLYIVRLIAEAHQGQAYARNLASDNAVQIGLRIAQNCTPATKCAAHH